MWPFFRKSSGSNHHVDGWDKFNAWIDRIEKCDKLTSKEREYILSRIDEEVNHGKKKHEKDYWSDGPIALVLMWTWTANDRERGVEKASDLGL